MTFSNLIESKGRVDGEMGDLSKKNSSDFKREGSLNDGEEIGLWGSLSIAGEGVNNFSFT